jgi:hypothetical protein
LSCLDFATIALVVVALSIILVPALVAVSALAVCPYLSNSLVLTFFVLTIAAIPLVTAPSPRSCSNESPDSPR